MTNQPQRSHNLITALMFTVILVVASLGFAAASPNTDNTGTVTGAAFIDANANGMREPDEASAPNVAITLQPVGATVVVAGGIIVFSDASGNYQFDAVAYGDYRIQAEKGDTVEISVSEVNAAVSVDLPIADSSNTPDGQGAYQIFLPLVTR